MKPTPHRPKVAVIDDSVFDAESWSSIMEIDVKTFQDPVVFLRHVHDNGQWLHDLDCIVIDFYFDDSSVDGNSIADQVRKLGFKGILGLSSESNRFHTQVSSAFDFILPKDSELAWQRLCPALSREH